MDRWKDSEVEKMKVGGNSRAQDFFDSQGDIHPRMSISEKYNSRTAALYRDKVRSSWCLAADWKVLLDHCVPLDLCSL